MMDVVLSDKSTPLYEMLNFNEIKKLMDNPDAPSAPWYGQLMRGTAGLPISFGFIID